MVTDRSIIVSNGRSSLCLTERPYTVQKIKGFDTLTIQNVTTQGYNQDGATLVNSYITPRDMEISGQMKALTTSDMQRLRDRMIEIFIPKKDITLIHFYGGVARKIIVRVEKSPEFSFTGAGAVQNYTISLVAVNPYWMDAEESVVQIANTVGQFHFPLCIPLTEGVVFGIKSSAMIKTIQNVSAMRIGMQYTFIANGSVKNPQLFNIGTREFMRLLCVMEAGEIITIQTGQERTVTRIRGGLTEDYIGRVDLAGGGSTFLELEPGDNHFRYGAEDGENVLEIEIRFSNQYIGV